MRWETSWMGLPGACIPCGRLGLSPSMGGRWCHAHIEQVEECCQQYFSRNPYIDWFRSLDHLIAGTGASFYGMYAGACHLDLIPYATRCKWTDLTSGQRSLLMSMAGNTLGVLLRDSSIRLIVVNGRAVIEELFSGWGTSPLTGRKCLAGYSPGVLGPGSPGSPSSDGYKGLSGWTLGAPF